MPKNGHRIAVLGLWHLGETYANGLASLGHSVVAIDEDPMVITNFLRGIPPLAEPGLEELIKKNLATGKITFSNDLKETEKCDVVWFAFDTPVDANDKSDLEPIKKMLHGVTPHLKDDVLIVVSSQVPAGTSATIQNYVKKARPDLDFHYAYSPENLRLGEALNCFLKPERIVVGASDDEAFRRVEDIFRGVNARIVRMSPPSAEMAKHALNAFLATSISFINDIADLCEEVGADIMDVIHALRSDARIGERAALNAGLGFSGGTLGRDLVSLSNLGHARKKELPVIESAFAKNLGRPLMLAKRLEASLGELKGKKIALYGLTYKPGTQTLRRSRSLEVAELLAARGATVVLCDPHVPKETITPPPGARVAEDVYEAADGAEALVFLTPWPDFKDIDFARLGISARSHAIVFDGTNFLREKEALIKKSGFAYHAIGRSI